MRGPTRRHAEKVRVASFAPTFARSSHSLRRLLSFPITSLAANANANARGGPRGDIFEGRAWLRGQRATDALHQRGAWTSGPLSRVATILTKSDCDCAGYHDAREGAPLLPSSKIVDGLLNFCLGYRHPRRHRQDAQAWDEPPDGTPAIRYVFVRFEYPRLAHKPSLPQRTCEWPPFTLR